MRNFQDTFETRKQSFISFFSICMTVPLNMLQVISASYSFNKTTSAYQIHIIHPTFHFPFPTVAADIQVNGYTDRQPDRQTGRQEERQEDSHTGQIHRYTCVMSVCRELSFCFLRAYQLSVDFFKIKWSMKHRNLPQNQSCGFAL